ncbi:MAG: hypothetical protein ACK47B_16780 [Armatimonadota bacterium]
MRVTDVRGGAGSGLESLGEAYGSRSTAAARLAPMLRRLAELAGGRTILLACDSYASRLPFPDAFFDLVEKHAPYCPITDWVPDLQAYPGQRWQQGAAPELEQLGEFLDPLAARQRVKLAYCATARVDFPGESPKLLLAGFKRRSRDRATTVILDPAEIGLLVFSGASDRFPDDFRFAAWFPNVNGYLTDRLLENKWLVPALLENTPAARLLPRWIPVGMGLRTAQEVGEFTQALESPHGFPVAVLKPSHQSLAPGRRFLDRTALRALGARQPKQRLTQRVALDLLMPRVVHSYEEITAYRGKLLDNLLRTPGAKVHDHGDGTFHFSAPYPFLESTVSLLQEYVDARPIRSRKTGKYHRGSLRVALFDGKIVAAFYRLDAEPDDGTFRDLTRPDVRTFCEAVSPDEEAALQAELGPFVAAIQSRAAELVTEDDLDALRRNWIRAQTRP